MIFSILAALLSILGLAVILWLLRDEGKAEDIERNRIEYFRAQAK